MRHTENYATDKDIEGIERLVRILLSKDPSYDEDIVKNMIETGILNPKKKDDGTKKLLKKTHDRGYRLTSLHEHEMKEIAEKTGLCASTLKVYLSKVPKDIYFTPFARKGRKKKFIFTKSEDMIEDIIYSLINKNTTKGKQSNTPNSKDSGEKRKYVRGETWDNKGIMQIPLLPLPNQQIPSLELKLPYNLQVSVSAKLSGIEVSGQLSGFLKDADNKFSEMAMRDGFRIISYKTLGNKIIFDIQDILSKLAPGKPVMKCNYVVPFANREFFLGFAREMKILGQKPIGLEQVKTACREFCGNEAAFASAYFERKGFESYEFSLVGNKLVVCTLADHERNVIMSLFSRNSQPFTPSVVYKIAQLYIN